MRRWGRDEQPRIPWQVKYLALVLIWGSSFLLMKVGLESLSAVQISALRILSGALVISLLLLAGGGRLPTGARVWGHLFVCGFFLGALPFTLFALSETRISSALAGIGNAATPIATVLATMAILPGERATGRRLVAVGVGFLGVITIMQPWTATDRPTSSASRWRWPGGASYGVGWTYNRRFLSGVDLGGLSQPAATLLTALVLMVPVSSCGRRCSPRDSRRCGPTTPRVRRGCGSRWCARSCSASWAPGSPTSSSSTSSAVPDR